jgi:hypothetical protein
MVHIGSGVSGALPKLTVAGCSPGA